jgi:hypothetical protein
LNIAPLDIKVATKTDEESGEENLFKCVSCGKDLIFPYYISIGIPLVLL